MTFLSQNVASVVLQVTLIVVFISVFFFLYATKIEEKIVTTQIDRLISSFTQDLSIILDESEKTKLKNFLQKMQGPQDMSESDVETKENNDKLIKKTTIVISILFAAGIITTIILCIYYNLDSWTIIKTSLFGLLACAITEFVFLTYIAAEYRSLDPNSIKKALVIALEDYANS